MWWSNLRAWLDGFGRFDEISFKAGWSGKSPAWLILYALNYGTRVLTGGACVSWSRWFYEHSPDYRWAKFVTRLLNKLDSNHGADSGPPLWGTQDTAWAVLGACLFWPVVLGLIGWGVVRLVL
jgi:hypothetical protein